MFFNLVKELLKYFEGLRRSVNIGKESESECIFDLACLRKKQLIGFQISNSKNSIVSHHKVFFNLVKDLFKYFEGLRISVKIGKESQEEWIVELAGLQKNGWYLVKFWDPISI